MKIKVDSLIIIEEPELKLIDYINKNLVVKNPMYYKLKKMGKRTFNIPKEIKFFEWQNNRLLLPRGLLNTIWDMYPDVALYDIQMNLCDEVTFNNNINLRSYQFPAIDLVRSSKQGIIKMPCGAGKTITALSIIAELKQPALWITHTKDLLKQSLTAAQNCFGITPGQFGIIGNGQYSIGTHITFATVQSLAQKELDVIKYKFGTIVIDECHRSFLSPTKAAQFSKVLSQMNARYRIGVTASEHRSDGLIESMYHLIGPKVYEVDQEVLRCTGNIVTPEVKAIPTQFEYEDMLDFSAMLVEMSNDENRNNLILKYLEDNKNNYCLVLSDRLGQLQELYEKSKEFAKCVYVDGSTKHTERTKALNDMKKGNANILFATYTLAKEGLDIPILNRLFLITPHKDKVVIQQSVGRIMRPSNNKGIPIVYDFVDVNIGLCKGQFNARKKVYKELKCDIDEKLLKS